MRHIYISPHFDDAVLSCGGLIALQSRQGLHTEIWTIMAGDPPAAPLSQFALENHALWGLPGVLETVAMRRAEDEQAAVRVGAELVHFDFSDCIYRRSPKGEPLYTQTVTCPPDPSDRKLPNRIAVTLRSELRKDDLLICPLALGGHVDHVLVRQAVEKLGEPVRYYADVPYVLNNPETLAPGIAALDSEFHPLSETDLSGWLEGVAAYQSQLSSLYKGQGTLAQAIRSYWAVMTGIRLWAVH